MAWFKPLNSQFKAFGSPLGYAYALENQADQLGFVSDYAPRLAHVDCHGHAGVRHAAPDVPLGFAQVGPHSEECRLVQRGQGGRVQVQLPVLLRTMLDV